MCQPKDLETLCSSGRAVLHQYITNYTCTGTDLHGIKDSRSVVMLPMTKSSSIDFVVALLDCLSRRDTPLSPPTPCSTWPSIYRLTTINFNFNSIILNCLFFFLVKDDVVGFVHAAPSAADRRVDVGVADRTLPRLRLQTPLVN